MLNHSRFPDGMPLPFMPAQSSRRARGAPTARFAVRLRVVLRFAQQPTGLTLPFGALMVSLPSQISAFCALTARSPCICSRLRVALPPLAATAHRADASLRCASGRFALRASAHRAHASLRATGHALPFGAPSGRFATCGPTAHWADASLRCPKALCRSISCKRFERPLWRKKRGLRHLTANAAGPCARNSRREVRRGLAAPPNASVSPGFAGRAGSLRPPAQTFLKHPPEKIAAGELFRRASAFRFP